MNKKVFLLLLAALALPASADTRFALGASAAYDLQFFTEVQPPTRKIITQLVHAGLFVDQTYLRLDISYAFTPAKPLSVKTDGVESAPSRPDDFWKMQLIQACVLGKLPIPVGPITVWPSLGLQYSVCMYLDSDGDGDNDSPSFDSLWDLYLVGGVGIDVPIGAGFFVTGGVFFDYNLTPSPDRHFTASYTWFDLTVKVGAGFRL
jgi:hypothetical protein